MPDNKVENGIRWSYRVYPDPVAQSLVPLGRWEAICRFSIANSIALITQPYRRMNATPIAEDEPSVLQDMDQIRTGTVPS